ncbi:MAG: right-handed parallel beta-helix repeat-containing protein [Prolixibacteraceae bacterium]|nr:right-handed parallel beta-helix repeat-containing protein [Prolixibacteraceae bacterium]
MVAGKVVVANLPAGLNARILKTSNLTLVAVLTGTATAHTNANDISNLKFTFQNSAFGEGYALAVTNYIKSNIEINFKQIINVGSSGDYTTIAEALAVCDNGDIINLAAETFTENNLEVGYRLIDFRVITNITIQGQGVSQTIIQCPTLQGPGPNPILQLYGGYKLTIKDLTIQNGNASIAGGAIYNYLGDLTLLNVQIKNSFSASQGGAIYSDRGNLSLTTCSVIGNSVSGNETEGGGLYISNGSATIVNSTIASNGAPSGAGIYCYMGNLKITNSTISRNNGTGISINSGSIEMLNTILAVNSASDYNVINNIVLTDNGYNVIEKQTQTNVSGNWRFTNSNDILYNYKADGSAGTQWTRNNAVLANQNLNIASAPGENSSINGTYTLALSSGSFAIDAAIGSGAPTTDQRGKARNGATDIGAFEYGGATVTLPTVSTTAISTYNATSATVGGTVSSDGGATVTEHGVVYSLSGTPDISDTKVQIGSGTGSFSQSVTGLLRSTSYFARAYASNSLGTAYGSVQTVTTESGKPVIANLNGDSGTFIEGDAPLAIDHGENGTVSNPDSDFNGGKLTVSGANSISEFTQITPSINLVLSNGMNSGSTITIGGTTIGSIATGKTGRMGSDLVISFNANATDELVGTLLHHISYSNTSEISLGTRSIYLTLQNALSLTSDAAIVTISTSVTNDAPTLTATASNPIFIEGNSTVSLFSNASASTIESGQTFTGLTLTVSNVTDGGFEYLLLDESLILLTNGTTGTSSVNSLTYSVSVSGSTATVSITSASLSVANLQTLINSLGYKDNNADLTEADRVVTITTLNDSGGTDNGGDDTAELTVASSVSVISGNPVITNLNGDSGLFKEGDSPLLIDSGSDATVINNSDSGFNGGNLTVAISSASATESLLIKTSATVVLSSGMAAGSSVSIDGTVIGTIAVGKDGQDGHDLLVDLNASATTALIATLIQNVSYSNNSEIDLGNRSVQVTVQNAIAFTSAVSTVTINAAAVNDPPTLIITATNPTFVEPGPATKVYSGATASTFESGQTFSEFAFTVNKLQDGSSEQVVIDGTYIALTAGNSGTTATNNLTYHVSVSFDIVWFAAVSVTGGSMSAESLQTVLNNLSYYNSSDSPTTTLNRIFRLTGLKDDGGTTNGGSNMTSLFINSNY